MKKLNKRSVMYTNLESPLGHGTTADGEKCHGIAYIGIYGQKNECVIKENDIDGVYVFVDNQKMVYPFPVGKKIIDGEISKTVTEEVEEIETVETTNTTVKKTKKQPKVTGIRIPNKLKIKVQDLAEKENRSFNAQVKYLLEKSVK